VQQDQSRTPSLDLAHSHRLVMICISFWRCKPKIEMRRVRYMWARSFTMQNEAKSSHACTFGLTKGRPFGRWSWFIASSGMSQRCMSMPRIAFSWLTIRTRFPLSTASGTIRCV
jgi:hypothetical protein